MRLAHANATDQRARVLTTAVTEVARKLDLGPSVLGRIIGVSQPTASRLLQGKAQLAERAGDKAWELSALLVRLYRGLYSIVGNSDERAQLWLMSRNRAFGDAKPIEVIQQIPGLIAACDYIDAHRAPI